MTRSITFLGFFLFLIDLGNAQDWSQFRGPNGTGLAPNAQRLPTEFGPANNVRWAVDVEPGHSSPVWRESLLVLTAAEGKKLLTVGIDRHLGQRLWTSKVEKARETRFHAKNHSASASAAIDHEVIVSFFDEFGLVAHDHKGRELWRQELGPFNNIYGMGASPILVDDLVILPCDQSTDSYLAAYDKKTGELAWRQDRPRAVSGHCTPIVRDAKDGVREVILPGSYLLDAYHAKTGERRWWVRGLPSEMKSIPALIGDTIYVHGYASPMNDLGKQIDCPPFEKPSPSGTKIGMPRLTKASSQSTR